MTHNSKQTTQRRNGTMGLEHIPFNSNIQSKKYNKTQKNIYKNKTKRENQKNIKKNKKQ